MQTQSPSGAARTQSSEDQVTARRAARIRLALIVAGVVAVLGFAFALWSELQEESTLERWDILAQLRGEGEPRQDPLWNNPQGVYNREREKYIRSLEKFLEQEALKSEDALAPQTRFLIAKTVADHILSNPNQLDRKERKAWYDRGAAQLEAIRDQHPDFPLNWSKLGEDGFQSLTRQFLGWLRENEKWENEHLLSAKAPDEGVRVLLRTERGDLLLGLYASDAPKWTARFLERVERGDYDGTCFALKEEVGDVAEPEQHFVMAGGAVTRGLAPYDADAAQKAAALPSRSGLLMEETRNRLPHERGIVSAWHPAGVEYDHDERFLVVVRRSPRLDYGYTPIGKLLEEDGVASFKTLDRIFGASVWREDRDARNKTEMKSLLDWMQAPVRIVKALVYRDGRLVRAAEGAETRAAVEETEKALSGLKADAYRVDPPVRPAAPARTEPGKPADSPDDPKEPDAPDLPDLPDPPDDEGDGDGD